MTGCTSFVVAFFIIKNAPLIIEKAWSIENSKKIKNKSLCYRIFQFIKKILISIFLFLQNIEVLYYLAYGVLAVLGTLIHPFFFSFHLTEILLR